MYNLNRIYPEFDRYAFSIQREKWQKLKHSGKVKTTIDSQSQIKTIKNITEDYDFDPDQKKLNREDYTERHRRNPGGKQPVDENMHEMVVLKNGDVEIIEGPTYSNLKMDEFKENMHYNSYGEVHDPNSINREEIYDINSNSSNEAHSEKDDNEDDYS